MDHRQTLQADLTRNNIHTLIHYPLTVHLQPAYQNRLESGYSLHHSESAAKRVLSLPMYPQLTKDQIETVGYAITNWCENEG